MKAFIRFLIRHVPRPVMLRFSHFFSFFFSFWYRGNKYSCPVCENSFRRLLPYGVTSRDNVLCPKCLSLERHRLLWLYWKNETNLFRDPLKVLHVAPEQCFLPRFRKMKHLDYTTGDLESPLADIHFDLHHIPLAENQYDLVICNHVLEHVTDDRKVMREILRILKPGGQAILQVPLEYDREKTYEDKTITSTSEREKHFGQKDHLRVFGIDYPERLRQEGFEVEEIPYPRIIEASLAEKYRLPMEELIYLSRKPVK